MRAPAPHERQINGIVGQGRFDVPSTDSRARGRGTTHWLLAFGVQFLVALLALPARATAPTGTAPVLVYRTYVDTKAGSAANAGIELAPCAPGPGPGTPATADPEVGDATTPPPSTTIVPATAPPSPPSALSEPAEGAGSEAGTTGATPAEPTQPCLPTSGSARPSADQAPRIDPQWIDDLLTEAVLDHGLGSLSWAELRRSELEQTRDLEALLIATSKEHWVISASLIPAEPHWVLRVALVVAGKPTLLVQRRPLQPDNVEVGVSSIMRDLIAMGAGQAPRAPPVARTTTSETPPSGGRAALALNAAVLGGYVGFSLQRASGPGDSRLTYPLLALGTGIGLGASAVIAEEWDISVADAWYLSAGALWPTTALVALDSAYERTPRSRRYLRSLWGTSGGLALATIALTQADITPGDAALTHSGGAFGALLGAIGQLLLEGDADTDANPSKGLGFGSLAGVIIAGGLAASLDAPRPESVLLIDLSAGLGLLTGAALASPLLLADEQTPTRDRLGLAVVGTGAVVGGIVGFLTQAAAPRSADSASLATGKPAWQVSLQPQADWSRAQHSFLSLGAHGSW